MTMTFAIPMPPTSSATAPRPANSAVDAAATEVSRLEENFNRMAGRPQASLDATRQLGEANARHEERTRIARELHDSISQELFSLSVLAGGLPAGSAVLPQVEIMERTAGDTMREMRSLLLALRPVALEGDDLPGALAGVCGSYGERLAIPVTAQLDLTATRETDVLKGLAQGRSNREIARALSVSEETVKSHVSSILAKLGLADRTQAAIFALQRHLVPLDQALGQ
jgi:signal transduction histidine kinase